MWKPIVPKSAPLGNTGDLINFTAEMQNAEIWYWKHRYKIFLRDLVGSGCVHIHMLEGYFPVMLLTWPAAHNTWLFLISGRCCLVLSMFPWSPSQVPLISTVDIGTTWHHGLVVHIPLVALMPSWPSVVRAPSNLRCGILISPWELLHHNYPQANN